MGLCEICGRLVPDSRTNCPTCGQRDHRAIPCAKCGYPAVPGTEQCTSCGRYLGKRIYLGKSHSTSEARRCLQQAGKTITAGNKWLDVAFQAQEAVPVTPETQNQIPECGTYFKRTDPYFLVAFILGAASLVFAWMPRLDLGLAGAAIIVSLLGYQRYFSYRQRGRYKGLWVNYLATVAGMVGLAMGFHFTPFL